MKKTCVTSGIHPLLLIVLLSIPVLLPGNLLSQNLIQNSGFETAVTPVPTGDPIPTYPTELNHWFAVNIDGEFIFDLTRPHSGTGMMSVLQNAGGNPTVPWLGIPNFGGFDRTGQKVSVQPSTQYTLSFWYKYGDGSRYGYAAGDLYLNIEQLLPAPLNIHDQIYPATGNWQFFTINFTTGPAATDIVVLFSCVGVGNVDMWIDDMELVESCSLDVDLGPDTVLCPGDNIILTPTGDVPDTYLWQDGSTNSTLNITQPGTYWVEATLAGCHKRDTIVVSYNPVQNIDLGNDTTLCSGDDLVLNPGISPDTYLWQDGSGNSTYNVTQPGTYWVEATLDGCSKRDSIVINYNPTPVLNLGPDTTLCPDQSILLDATAVNATYSWQDNSTNATYTVTQTGTYWVEVTINNCTGSDTVVVNYSPAASVNLGNDTSLCGGATLVYNVTVPNGFYTWQDGYNGSAYTVNQPGLYWVEVSVGNCHKRDSVNINFIPVPQPDLGADTSLCDGDSLLLDATMANATYLWQDNSTDSTFLVAIPGVYWVTVTANGCSGTDTIHIEPDDCKVQVDMPNVFTPDGDGFNDFFFPVVLDGITHATLTIYNRWGTKIFETTDAATGWDGKVNGQDCSEGTYYWILSYTDIFNQSNVLNGFLTLVK